MTTTAYTSTSPDRTVSVLMAETSGVTLRTIWKGKDRMDLWFPTEAKAWAYAVERRFVTAEA